MLFKRYIKNPIIKPSSAKYENDATYNPAVIVHQNKVYLFYRAEGKKSVSRLCLAISDDGYNFKKYEGNPIIKPTIYKERGGCEDPRITKIGDTFYLLYTSFNGVLPVTAKSINESYAVSQDLKHWDKKGIFIKGLKSASFLEINGKYYIFIGGEDIRVGESKDLKNWKIDEKAILKVRKDKFDSRYVEVGPPPFVYKNKIVFFFNVADDKGVFRTSLALLDKNNPRRVLYRADEPLMIPTKKYELYGKVKTVIFGSGMIEFKGKYFYYYGAADRYIAVATVSKKKMKKYLDSLL